MNDLVERSWKSYRALSKAPSQQRPICNLVLSMIGSLRLIDDYVQDNDLHSVDKRAIHDLKIGCNSVLLDLETALAGVRSRQSSLDTVSSTQSKLLDQTNRLESFYLTLRGYSQKNITDNLEQILEIKSADFRKSVIRKWASLNSELQKLGISKHLIDEEFFYIDGWLKEHHPTEDGEAAMAEDAEDLPPGYTPGAQQAKIAEKVQSLQDTARTMSINTLAVKTPDRSVGTTATAEPPPYTVEEGGDQIADEEFSRYIEHCIGRETSYRQLRQQRNPEIGPHPYSWLPTAIREDYKSRNDIIPLLDGMSFSTMAYETAPRCNNEIERFTNLLQTSFDHKHVGPGNGAIGEAFYTLELMLSAMKKFGLLEDSRPGSDNFSDLDIYDFQQSTAVMVDENIKFPQKEFDLAQKSCYVLLTYIMGMLGLFTLIFPGRNYTSRTMDDLENLWEAKKMSARTAWVSKQIAEWGKVEDAVRFCRDWHQKQLGLQAQAMLALDDWQKTERLFSSRELNDEIELTIISASGLPKPNFRTPTAWVKAICYGQNQFGGLLKLTEYKTEVAPKSQSPTWNTKFFIKLPNNFQMIVVEIFDRVAGIDQQLSKVRLLFSFIPGVEANFANRSLVYGYDENCEFPLKLVTSGKGKEKEPPTLRLGLKWAGLLAKAEAAGLPTSPPGKMFRSDFSGIPMSPEDRRAMRMSSQYHGASSQYSRDS